MKSLYEMLSLVCLFYSAFLKFIGNWNTTEHPKQEFALKGLFGRALVHLKNSSFGFNG